MTNAARILAFYFKDRKVNIACDAKDWKAVRTLVNGGLNGYTDFVKIINDFLNATPPMTPQTVTSTAVSVVPKDKFAFLTSTRFWANVIGAVAIMFGPDGIITGPEIYNGLLALAGAFVAVGTLDSIAEKLSPKSPIIISEQK